MFTVSDEHCPFVVYESARVNVHQLYCLHKYSKYLNNTRNSYATNNICSITRTRVTYEYILWNPNKLKGNGLIAKVLLINIPKITPIYIQLRYEDMCFNITILFLSWANNLFGTLTSDNCIKITLGILIAQCYLTLNTFKCVIQYDLASFRIWNPNQNPTLEHLRSFRSGPGIKSDTQVILVPCISILVKLPIESIPPT